MMPWPQSPPVSDVVTTPEVTDMTGVPVGTGISAAGKSWWGLVNQSGCCTHHDWATGRA